MSTETDELQKLEDEEYKYGSVTDKEEKAIPPGLSEDGIRLISHKKQEPEWMLEWRLKAFRHWQTLEEPKWANIKYEPVDYQAIAYYSAPKSKKEGPQEPRRSGSRDSAHL